MSLGTCRKCGKRTIEVTDSRPTGEAIRRRRVCASCGERFTTYERRIEDLGIDEETAKKLGRIRRALDAAIAEIPDGAAEMAEAAKW